MKIHVGPESTLLCRLPKTANNKSVENTCVAFVKGANKRNEFLEKINNNNVWRTSSDEQDKGLTISGTN